MLDSPNPLPKSGDCAVTSAPFFTRKLTFAIMLCLGGLAACSKSSTPQELTAVARARPPSVRMGAQAETFLEFSARVGEFIAELPGLPGESVIFGHGIWFGMLCWKL
jgi:hypothetical protein